jgi:hypothetical protein
LKYRLGLAGALLPALLLADAQTNSSAALPSGIASQVQSAWPTSASVSLKEALDSNDSMKEATPQANQDSAVRIIIPALNAQWKPDPKFSLSLG